MPKNVNDSQEEFEAEQKSAAKEFSRGTRRR